MGSSLPGGGEADWPGYWLLSDMEADTKGGEADTRGGEADTGGGEADPGDGEANPGGGGSM